MIFQRTVWPAFQVLGLLEMGITCNGHYLHYHKIQGITWIITRFRVLPALSQDSGYYLHYHRIQGITCIITGFRVLPALSQDSGYYLHYHKIQGITCIITGFRVLPALSQDSGYYLHYHKIQGITCIITGFSGPGVRVFLNPVFGLISIMFLTLLPPVPWGVTL